MSLLKKWIPPGIIFKPKITVPNKYDLLFELSLFKKKAYISRSQFHYTLGNYSYPHLIDIKKSLVLENSNSEDIRYVLNLVDLQLTRLNDYHNNFYNGPYKDVESEMSDLREGILEIRKYIILAHKANKYEKVKFGYEFNHSNNLHYKLMQMGIRMNQLMIEGTLPNIDYPAVGKTVPSEWIKEVGPIVKNHKDPYNAAFSIRLSMDRIKKTEFHIFKQKFPIEIDKKNQFFKVYKLSKYKELIDQLMQQVDSEVSLNKWKNKIKEIPGFVQINRPSEFKKMIGLLVDNGAMKITLEETTILESLLKKDVDLTPNKVSFPIEERLTSTYFNVLSFCIETKVLELSDGMSKNGLFQLLQILHKIDDSKHHTFKGKMRKPKSVIKLSGEEYYLTKFKN